MKYIKLLCDRCGEFYEKHQFKIKLIMILLISFVPILYGWLRMGDSSAYKDLFLSSAEGNLTDKIKNGDVIEQDFTILDDSVQGVAVCFATYQSKVTEGKILAEILDEEGNVFCSTELPATNIRDNEYLDIMFDTGQITKKEEKYTLKMTFDGIENQSVVCWLSDDYAYSEYAMKINGVKDEAVLVFREISNGKDVFYQFYMGIMFLFILLIIVVYFMIYRFQLQLWKVYIPVGIFLGILYLMIVPIFAVPDEPSHAYTAYQVSNGMLGIENSADGTIVMRKDDAENGFAITGINRHYYNEYLVKLTNFFVDHEELVTTGNKPVKTYPYLYFFSALGLTIGRLLHFAPIVAFLLGRLCNLVVFIIAVTYALKKITFGKAVVFLWAILPMTLQQASSYSYDAIIFSLSVVIISLSVRLAYEKTENIKRSEWIILWVCVMFLAPTKSFALFPVCALFFIIYFKKYKEGKKSLYYTLGVMGTIVLFIVGLKIISMMSGIDSVYGKSGNIIKWANEPGYTVGYFLHHPKELFSILCNTIYLKGEFYFETFLGSSLGWFELNIPLITVLPYFILLIIAGMRKKDELVYLSRKMKIYFCGLAVLGIGFACAGMLLSWTPVSYTWIEGVQGRYFLPFVIMLFLSVRSEKISVDKSVDNKLIFSGVWLEMLVFLFIYIRAL